ncbi:6-phosphogluconate dehydrogenase [Apiospora arundinis]|uniref:6-phosphogluconate dehydrogenase n=1 Tax=Apiospora arundinis TaxID=335852 RepID=A0ABR2J5Z2_9PEZI
MRASLVRKLPGLQARCLRRPAIHIARRSLHQLSIAVTGKPSKGDVLNSLKRELELSSQDKSADKGVSAGHKDGHASQQNTAVILASPELASWSDDHGFMSQLLAMLHRQRQRVGDTSAAEGESHIDVLFGVTDGIADPSRLHSKPYSGLSILYGGTTSLLPSLWKRQDKRGVTSAIGDSDRASSILFTNVKGKDGLHAETQSDLSPEVTLPLANTIFQNGRRSTLFASRWSPNPSAVEGNEMELTRLEEKSQQEIVCLQGSRSAPPRIPLMPLAPPRKIVAGLGNIVRQVDIDGVVSPASKELEILIPQIFEKRAAQAPTPIGVWAWVIPEHYMKAHDLATSIKSYHGNQGEEEWRLVADALQHYEQLLHHDSRLHKILSGGGGWGAKQGLLSLDPETTYAAPEQDDIDSFIRAFEMRHNSENQTSSSSDGIVAPGSYVLFCAEPQHMDKALSGPTTGAADSTFALAVAPTSEELLPQTLKGESKKGGAKVEVRPGHFGAASSTGLYLSEPWLKFATKVDAPYSVLSWR